MLLVQGQALTLFIDGFDTGKETFIQADGSAVLAEFRAQLHLQSLHFCVRLCRREVVEAVEDYVQQLAAVHIGFDGVLKGRSLGIVDNRINVSQTLLHALFDGRHVVLHFDFIKRIRAMRRVPVLVI